MEIQYRNLHRIEWCVVASGCGYLSIGYYQAGKLDTENNCAFEVHGLQGNVTQRIGEFDDDESPGESGLVFVDTEKAAKNMLERILFREFSIAHREAAEIAAKIFTKISPRG